DRIRMADTGVDPGVFIRSMATRGHAGGLALATFDAVRVLDAMGSDLVFVETVGAGQSEVEIASRAHTTVVVEMPLTGDVVQTMKAGILEIGDVYVVNKVDLGNEDVLVANLKFQLETRDGWRPPRMVRPAGSTRTPQRGNCWDLALRRGRPLAGAEPLPIHGVEELLEPGHPVAPGGLQRGDVDVVPDRLEELEHPESVVAHPLPGLFLGLLDIPNRMPEFLRQRGGEVSKGQLVAGEFHGLAERRLRVVKCPSNELPDVLHRHELL